VAESLNHVALLQRLFDYVQGTMNGKQHLAILHDLPAAIGCEKPPSIGAFRPDLYASDAPTTRVIIGEAKTAQDLETPHSRQQINAYAQHLAMYPGSTFILAVPWHLRGRAHALMSQAVVSACADQITLVVIDDLQEMPR